MIFYLHHNIKFIRESEVENIFEIALTPYDTRNSHYCDYFTSGEIHTGVEEYLLAFSVLPSFKYNLLFQTSDESDLCSELVLFQWDCLKLSHFYLNWLLVCLLDILLLVLITNFGKICLVQSLFYLIFTGILKIFCTRFSIENLISNTLNICILLMYIILIQYLLINIV